MKSDESFPVLELVGAPLLKVREFHLNLILHHKLRVVQLVYLPLRLLQLAEFGNLEHADGFRIVFGTKGLNCRDGCLFQFTSRAVRAGVLVALHALDLIELPLEFELIVAEPLDLFSNKLDLSVESLVGVLPRLDLEFEGVELGGEFLVPAEEGNVLVLHFLDEDEELFDLHLVVTHELEIFIDLLAQGRDVVDAVARADDVLELQQLRLVEVALLLRVDRFYVLNHQLLPLEVVVVPLPVPLQHPRLLPQPSHLLLQPLCLPSPLPIPLVELLPHQAHLFIVKLLDLAEQWLAYRTCMKDWCALSLSSAIFDQNSSFASLQLLQRRLSSWVLKLLLKDSLQLSEVLFLAWKDDISQLLIISKYFSFNLSSSIKPATQVQANDMQFDNSIIAAFYCFSSFSSLLWINFHNLKIMKNKNKMPNSSSRQKLPPPRPKPQFSTDFVDRQKYKLTETEMIQKKAALQSKHRQQAIEELQERRKKLEMGIIDEDTRKVYETALTSKKIDLNPSIRRNLSQMIQYEREKQREDEGECREVQNNEENCNPKQESEQYQKQLKEAEAFIRKFEKAKKMDKIQRAVNFLTDDVKSSSLTKPSPKAVKLRGNSKEKKPIFQNSCINNNVLSMKESTTSLNTSTNQQILSNIEDTIKFMEERLFSATRIDKLKKEQKKAEPPSRIDLIRTSYSQKNNQFDFNRDNNLYQQTLEISQLQVKEEMSEDQNQCMDTIRRMKEMIDSKQSIPQPSFKRKMKENVDFGNTKQRFQQFSTVQKHTPHYTQSDAEIDFSLTLNNSESHSHQEGQKHNNSGYFSGKFGRGQNQDEEYQRIKKSLFEEVNRLQLHSIHDSEPSFQAKTQEKAYSMNDQSSIPNMRILPTPSPTTNKKPKKNAELERLRSQINGTKSSVQAIKIETPSQGRNQVIGMDFRGSFNIKKNVVQN